MADHVAEQIVAAAKTALTGLATTGANVFDSRVYPLQDAELPALKLDQGDETDEVITFTAPVMLERRLELLVIACVKQTTSYRTAINTIRKEVEVALADNGGLMALCKTLVPSGCTVELSGEGEKPVAEATMRFTVQYYTAQNAPDVAL